MLSKNEIKYLKHILIFQNLFYLFILNILLFILIPMIFYFNFPYFLNKWGIILLLLVIFLIWNTYNAFRKNHPLEKNIVEEEGVLIINPSENGSYYLWNQKPIELPSHWELRHIRPILHKTIKLKGYYSRKNFIFGIIKLSALHALSLDQFSIDKEMQNGFFIKKPIIQLLHIPMIILLFQFLIFTSEISGDLNEQKKILQESSLPASALPSIENINSIQNEFYIFLILFIFLCFLESILIFYTIRVWKYNSKISNAIIKDCYEVNLN